MGGIERLDVLVHSAGVGVLGTVAETPAGTWRRQFEINVVAVAELTRLLLPALRAARGRVVLLNSGAGLTARPGLGVLRGEQVRAAGLRRRAARRGAGHGVRVTSIHPGRVDTEMQRAVVAHEGGEYTGRVPAAGVGGRRRAGRGDRAGTPP